METPEWFLQDGGTGIPLDVQGIKQSPKGEGSRRIRIHEAKRNLSKKECDKNFKNWSLANKANDVSTQGSSGNEGPTLPKPRGLGSLYATWIHKGHFPFR